MSKGMRTGVVMAGAVALSVSGFVVQAQDEVDPHFQSHALRYAGMIERAYGRLYGHIRSNESVPVSWSGAAVPLASTGWEAVWTEAGLRARYCDNVLVVYMGFSEVKGVGGEHRAIQQARRSFLPERERGVKLPLLSWLEAGDVVDAHGNVRPLDPCMTASYSEPLPSGRAALAGAVVDPATVVRERESYEYRVEPCPAGQHGQVRERRTVRRTIDGNDNEVETPAYEAWESTPASWCRADYTYHELFTRPCRWYQGEPFNREMEGTETWRVPVGVSKDPENPVGGIRKTPGASEFVSSTCWDTPPGDVPVPSTSHEYFTETHILSCPPNMSGQIDVARQRITTTTTYPWGEAPLMTVSYTNWSETSNSCTRDRLDDGGSEGGPESIGGPAQGGDGQSTGQDHPDEAAWSAGVGGGIHDGVDFDGDGAEADGTFGPDGAFAESLGMGDSGDVGSDGSDSSDSSDSSGGSGNEVGGSDDGGFDGSGGAFWCFTEAAEVLLADGSVKAAGKVQLSDELASPEGTVDVVAVYRDRREKRWVSVNGTRAFFTVSHPVVTGRGVVTGGELRVGDRIRRFDGGWDPVRTISAVTEVRLSINIETTGNTPFFVEGWLFGSYGGYERS